VNKAAEAFRTISEVAAELDVPKHVLRFWEVRFPQLRPMKRGGGRRYYRPEDLDLLRGIRHLLHVEGYTIKGVQKILRSQGIEQVKQSWRAAAEKQQGARGESAQEPSAGTFAERGAGVAPALESAAGATAVGGEGLSPAQRKLILAAISELESCRRLLTTGLGEAAARRSPRRARFGR
jgi:DNA-binding transcriptional MerR regulator